MAMTGNMPMKVYRIYDDESSEGESEKKYREGSRKKVRWIVLFALLTVAIMILTPVINNPGYNPVDILKAFFTLDTTSKVGTYVWQVDMPIFFGALIAGAALSVAGAVMQCILRNPLASPYTLGLSNAAAFGAALSMMFFTDGMVFSGVFGDYITPIFAFVFAMVATLIIMLLTKVTRVSSETMVLAGIAVSAIFSAGITLMQYIADPVQLSSIVTWMFGSVSNASWYWDLVLFNALLLVSVYFFARRWDMNAMNTGNDVAKGVGVNTERFLMIGLVLSAALAALIVSRFGVIAFVGLLGPHMARMLIGDDHRYLIPMSILFGAVIMTLANLVATNIVAPVGLPVGLLTALLGGPVFIYLLIRRYRA